MVRTEQDTHSELVNNTRKWLKMSDEELRRRPSFDVYRVEQSRREGWSNVYYYGVCDSYVRNGYAESFLEEYGAHVIIDGARTAIGVDNLEALSSLFPPATRSWRQMLNSGPNEHFLYKGGMPFQFDGIVVGTNIEGVRLDLSGAAVRPDLKGDLLRAGMLVTRT